MAARNIKLTIRYDGSRYHGWAAQPDVDTVQRQIELAIERLCGQSVKVNGASRTDAGVSALGQVANVRIDTLVPTENFARALTEKLPEEIAVVEAAEVDDDFDAISCAQNKYYRYTICTAKERPVLQIHHCWHYPYELDRDRMNAAARSLIGRKDFKSFAAAADQRQTSVRTVRTCSVSSSGQWTYVDIEADGFLYNMVRNITGTLIEVGRGHWEPEKIAEILAAKDRTAAGPIAPASGLCLIRIDY